MYLLSAVIMAARLSRSVMWKNGSWLLQCPTAVARVCSMGVGSSSSAPGTLSAFQGKPRTVEELPHVSFLELMYRIVFQGFYKRMHELQVRQAAVPCSARPLDDTDLHVECFLYDLLTMLCYD